jgi:hypothetical protein
VEATDGVVVTHPAGTVVKPPLRRYTIFDRVSVGEHELDRLKSTSANFEESGLTGDLVDAAVAWKRELRRTEPAAATAQPTSIYLATDFLVKLRTDGVTEKMTSWRKKVKMFNMGHVYVPCNEKMKHWTLYVICNPTEANPTGSILFMDSISTGAASRRVVQLLRDWLKARASWESRREAAAVSFDASKHTYELIVYTVPTQPNYVDCGLFVACNIDAFEASRAAGNDGTTVRLRAASADAHGPPLRR